MPRKSYQRTDETFNVLSRHEAEIAREMECDPSYINKVKNGVELDRHAFYREMFRAVCNTNAPAEIWLNDLQSIYLRSRRLQVPASDLSGKILEKIQTDSDALQEIISSLQDRKLDKSECHTILAKLAKNKEINDSIEQAVLAQLGELNEKEEIKLRAV